MMPKLKALLRLLGIACCVGIPLACQTENAHQLFGLAAMLTGLLSGEAAEWLLCMLGGVLSLGLLRGIQRWAWMAFFAVLACSMHAATGLARSWPAWRHDFDQQIVHAYVTQTSWLCLVPVLAWLVNRGQINRDDLARGLRAVGLFQAAALVLQFVLWRIGGPAALEAASMSSPLYAVTDGHEFIPGACRFCGLSPDPNTAATILVLTWASWLAGSPAEANESRRAAVLRRAVLGLCVVALALTYSRSGFVAFVVQAAVWLCYARRTRWTPSRPTLAIMGAVAAGLGLLLAVAPGLTARLAAVGELGDASICNRLFALKALAHVVAQRPVCGFGPGAFNTFYNLILRNPAEENTYHDVHSAVGNLLGEVGLFGVLIGLIAMVGLRPRKTLAAAGPRAIMAIAGGMFIMISENPADKLSVIVLWIWLLGDLVGSAQRTRESGSLARTRRQPLAGLLTFACVTIWAAAWLMPAPTPDDFYATTVAGYLGAGNGSLRSFVAVDGVTGRAIQWQTGQTVKSGSGCPEGRAEGFLSTAVDAATSAARLMDAANAGDATSSQTLSALVAATVPNPRLPGQAAHYRTVCRQKGELTVVSVSGSKTALWTLVAVFGDKHNPGDKRFLERIFWAEWATSLYCGSP